MSSSVMAEAERHPRKEPVRVERTRRPERAPANNASILREETAMSELERYGGALRMNRIRENAETTDVVVVHHHLLREGPRVRRHRAVRDRGHADATFGDGSVVLHERGGRNAAPLACEN
jgi:hypothetical protein